MLSTFSVLAAMSPIADKARKEKQIKAEEEAHARGIEREKQDLTTKYEAAKGALSEKEQAGLSLGPKERKAAILKYETIGGAGRELYDKFPSAELADEISGNETMLRSLSQKEARYAARQQRAKEDLVRLQEEKRRSEAIRKMITEV